MKGESSVYRPMIVKALTTAWTHKELWPFALLASLAGTGVIVNDVLKQARIMFAPSVETYQGVVGNAWVFIITYLRNLVVAGEDYLVASSFAVVLVVVSAAFIIAASQQILLVAMHRAVKRKKRLKLRETLQSVHHLHVLRVVGVDLLFRLAAFIVMTGAGLLLRNLMVESNIDAMLAILLSAATLAIAFALNIIAMFALVGVAREELTIGRALREGMERLIRNPIVAGETAAILFAINLVLSFAYLLGLAFLAAPSALLFAEAISGGSLVAMIVVGILSLLALIVWTGVSAGFATTFTYATWTELVERCERSPFTPRIHAYSRRLIPSKRSRA